MVAPVQTASRRLTSLSRKCPSRRLCLDGSINSPVVNSADVESTRRLALRPSLFVDPLIGKCHWRPAIAAPFLMQASQARRQHMRPRDHNILARELKQQLLPSRKSRRRVDVENHRDLGMLQLDALSVHGVSPKQEFLSLGRKFVTGMPRSMTMQRHDFDAVNDLLGVAKRTPLAGLDVWRCDA